MSVEESVKPAVKDEDPWLSDLATGPPPVEVEQLRVELARIQHQVSELKKALENG